MKNFLVYDSNGLIIRRGRAPDPENQIYEGEFYLEGEADPHTQMVIGCQIMLRPKEDIKAELMQKRSLQCRSHRNNCLSECDWTQSPDAPVDQAAWAIYRQSLRDITQQTGFPSDVTWPIKPE